MDPVQLELKLQKQAVAPRVTWDGLQSNIKEVYYTNVGEALKVAEDHPLRLMVKCYIVLQNGFVVYGESACVSKENYNEAVGMEIARANAVAKIWPLMGYALKEKLNKDS